MGSWKEKIEQAIQERNRRLQLAAAEEDRIKRTQEESRRNAEGQIHREQEERRLRIEAMLKKLNAEELLRKSKAEIWEGYGNIVRTHDGIRLVFGFNTVISVQVSSGWGGSDGAGYYSHEASKASGITFTEVSIDDISKGVRVRDGEIKGTPYGILGNKDTKDRWNAFITKGGPLYRDQAPNYRDTIQTTHIPFGEASASTLEEAILQFGIWRVSASRLPRQLE